MPSVLGTPVEPSRICLGTGSFGSALSRDDSFRIMDVFYELGGNFFDSAHIYAVWMEGGAGASERTLGEWVRVNGLRDKVVIGTKGGHPPLGNMSQGRLTPEELASDLGESLERLGTDRIDLYWLHRDDPRVPVGDIMGTLAGFVCEGRIVSCGGSNWTCERFDAANQVAQSRLDPPFVASQPGWALARIAQPPPPEADMLYVDDALRQWHTERQFPAVPYSSQAHGYFGEENVAWARGGFAGEAPRGKTYDSSDNRMRLLRAIELAKEHGCTANRIALAYLMAQPFPVYPIISTTKPERLRDVMGSLEVRLTDEERDSLD